MTDNEKGITDGNRYNRYAEDWRFQHKLIWEIPTVTMAIIAGILTVAFSFIGLSWPRLAVLSLGTLLIFSLAVAVFKHRYGADLRTKWLEDLDKEGYKYRIKSDLALKDKKPEEEKEVQTGDRSKESDKIRIKNEITNLWPKFMIRWSSEKFLICFMFIAFAVILILAIYTLMELCCGLPPLEFDEKNTILEVDQVVIR
jgi:hypothetical protein